jgi:hypothetical protein
MKKPFHILILCAIILVAIRPTAKAQTVSTFESLPLGQDTFWNGSEMPNGTYFQDGNGVFPNFYSPDFGGYWGGGWAYSSMRDSTTAGFTNLYSAITGIGFDGSQNYAVGTFNPLINVSPAAIGKVVSGFYITNATYAALSMRDGDAFAKKFGGDSGNDPDWFKITLRSYFQGALSQDSVDMYLADFRFMDNDSDYILKTWEWVDLTSLGNTDSLQIYLSSSDNGAFGMNTPAYFCIDDFTTADYEAFAPPVGELGTTAIHKDSSVFVAWATGVQVTRGYQDISDPSLGYASYGDSTLALGQADGDSIVSLGDGGSAIVTFAHPIINGDGADFAVFENSFSDSFLELAFVEVSSDGVNYFRFPATSYTQAEVQLDLGGMIDAIQINNLAGKYRGMYGTPFDLEELASEPNLNVNHITHIRLIDVVGSINPAYASYDQYGNAINDPWTTPFPSCGFDLDAVGVIHSEITATNELSAEKTFTTYPNPASDVVYIRLEDPETTGTVTITLADYTGRIITSARNSGDNALIELNLHDVPPGIYFASMITPAGTMTKNIVVQK